MALHLIYDMCCLSTYSAQYIGEVEGESVCDKLGGHARHIWPRFGSSVVANNRFAAQNLPRKVCRWWFGLDLWNNIATLLLKYTIYQLERDDARIYIYRSLTQKKIIIKPQPIGCFLALYHALWF